MPAPADVDVAVIGAGIVGLATADALLARHRQLSVVVVDKEQQIASHQSGRNSGVIHSGIYYTPGSNKATMATTGRRLLVDFVREQEIAHELCGKVIVAVDATEAGRLDELHRRARANGVRAELLDAAGLGALEPNVAGVAALHVRDAGIVDFMAVCTTLVGRIQAAGGELRLGWPVTALREEGGGVVIAGPSDLRARWLVNCGGLQSDRLASMTTPDHDVRIMPFRGEYYELVDSAKHLINDLVYPVPDPAFPFLGVHFTRMIDGEIHAGPNAVPALAREGYRWRTIDRRDAWEIVRSPGTWRLARRYWRTGLGEIHRSLSKRAFVGALQRLCPAVTADDLRPAAAGVRAQAIDSGGNLLDDFNFAESDRAVHVVNAPSPAATASLAIGRAIVDRLDTKRAR